jgi:predicted ATPase/class 3 adenylate cyclase
VKGVLSIVFTDIVASTRLWADDEENMAADLERHDALIAEIVGARDGSIVKHTGDGMMAVFNRPLDAINAAVSIQRAIEAETWTVQGGIVLRAAVHSGVARERAGDMFGPAVNRAARLMGICPSGAVLVSEATASLLTDGLRDDIGLVEVAAVQLRDFAQTEVVYAASGEGLTEVTAASLPLAAGATVGILPAYEDEIIGRSDELSSLAEDIARHPLVTVVGTGGLGKTRLAAGVARDAATLYSGGVWWCDLSSATSDAAIASVAAASVGARQRQGRSAVESLCDHLAGRRALVVLDNCEHVVTGVRDLVTTLRNACPDLHVLCTSREELGLRGERVVRLGDLDAGAARHLFIIRATEVRPDIEWDQRRVDAVDTICDQLDRLPLAIELAAARCRALSPTEIAERLDQRFRLLRGGDLGGRRDERHRTLEAAIDWSYSMLAEEKRWVFDHLAMFPGGASLPAVASVTGRDELDVADILDALAARSMIVVSDTPLGTRYRQLETMRQFAAARLEATGTAESAHQAFIRWALDTATELHDNFLSAEESWAMRCFVAEIDNLRTSVLSAAAMHDLGSAGRILSGLVRWALYRPAFELIDWVAEDALVAACGPDIEPTVVATLGELAFLAGDTRRSQRLVDAAAAAEPTNAAVAASRAALGLWVDGDAESASTALDSAQLATPHERFIDQIYRLHVATFRWMIDPGAAVHDRSQPVVAAGLALVNERRAAGSTATLAHSLAVLGYLHLAVSDFDASITCAREAATIARQAEASFAVDAAQICLVSAFGQIQMRRPDQRETAARELRSVLAATLDHRNWFFVGALLAAAVPVTLWSLGARHDALLVQLVGARHYPNWPDLLPRRGLAELDPAERAAIEAEALELDLDGATRRALKVIDGALDINADARPATDPEAAHG